MINKNTDNQNNKRKLLENNKSSKYYRCCSVDEKINNPCFSKDLEKEYLDIKHLVRNSVEKINILFNKEEFKQRTTKKTFQNNLSKINVNKLNFNKRDTSHELFKKENEKNNIYQDNNFDKAEQKNLKKVNTSFFGDSEEYKYNSNELLEELKELNSNRLRNEKKVAKFFQQKKSNNTETDNKALLNLESNKLYRNKEQNTKIKKLDLSNYTNYDKNQKDGYIANYLKTAKHQNIQNYKEKKIEPIKYIQKNNNNKKILRKVERNNNILKPRLSNNSTLSYYKNIERKNKGEKTVVAKYSNNTFKKDSSFFKKKSNNSMSIDNDINLNLRKNESSSKLNINDDGKDKNNKIDKDKIFISINKHLYQGEKRNICLNQILNEFSLQKKKVDNCKKKKSNYNNLNTKDIEFPSLKNGSPSRFINSNGKNKKFEKISTKNFLKMMLMLNQYLINNNLIDDYANPENKKIFDEFSNFLNKNIKKDNHKKKENDIDYDKSSGLNTERIIKKDVNLNDNINSDIKNNRINNSKNKCSSKNMKLDFLFNNIINKYNLISENNN